MATDCITDRSEETHNMYLWNMGMKYADNMTSAEIIEEINKIDKLEYAFLNPGK